MHRCSLHLQTTGRTPPPKYIHQELKFVFVDQETAFDRVNRNKLWQALRLRNVIGQLLDNIRAIYANSMDVVQAQNDLQIGLMLHQA